MGTSKTEAFAENEIALAAIAKALAHPARIAILKILAQKNSCVCGDIVLELPLAQATVSQHLKELKDAGLIRGSISGPRVCYCIDYTALERAKLMLDTFININLKPGLNCNC